MNPIVLKAIVFSSLLFCFLSLISFNGNATDVESADKIQWHEWSAATFNKAKQENKLILVDIKAQWCEFCKKMSNVTYKDPEVVRIINENYIAIRGDIEKTIPITRRYGYFGVPATVILTADDKELNRRLGYIKPQFMQWHLLGILQDYQQQSSRLKKNVISPKLVTQN